MILVTGATGTIGRHLVRELTERGTPFRALVRDRAKGEALGHPFAVGDFADPASLAAALEGVDRLFLNGPGAQPVTGPQPMVAHQRAAIDAARAAGVARIVKVSAWRPSPDSRLSVLAHHGIDRHLRAAGPAWATLRPTGFMQNLLAPAAFAPDGALAGPYGTGRVAYVDARDIAACAAVLLTGDEGLGRDHDLTGPEALTHAEIADLLGVPFRDVPPGEAGRDLRAAGLPAGFVDDLLWLYAEMADGSMSETTTAVRDLTGREPYTFARFAADHR
ncbi:MULTISPECIES: NAD(P)H-binding protein [unclassified Nocardiopsis]|uniref:NAD(P)H-binding protein n=1 Tax=Nocardiopsis TaxID=2013 RepID=UPI00387B1185